MYNVGLTTTPNRNIRAKSARASGGSVASCMNWYQPQPPNPPNVPRATNTVVLAQPAGEVTRCTDASFSASTVPVPPPPPPISIVKMALTD